MKDPVDPPVPLQVLPPDALEGCALDHVDQGTSGPAQLDGSPIGDVFDAPEARADYLSPAQIALAALGRTKRKRMARNLPEVSEERIRELAAEYEGRDPARNAKVMKYERESPPLPPEARAAFARLQRIDMPDRPGIYYLWEDDRCVFVGRSKDGVLGPTIAANTIANRRYGSLVKKFGALMFQPCPEGLLDSAVAALVRQFKPKYNRRAKPRPDLRENDQRILRLLGFLPAVGDVA